MANTHTGLQEFRVRIITGLQAAACPRKRRESTSGRGIMCPYSPVTEQSQGLGYYVLNSFVAPTATDYVNLSSDSRMKLEGWYMNGVLSSELSFVATQDMNLTAAYEEQFLVTVTSEYGKTSGSGWYNKGSQATVSVAPTSVADQGILGTLGFKSIMMGWTGTGIPFSPGERSGLPSTLRFQ